MIAGSRGELDRVDPGMLRVVADATSSYLETEGADRARILATLVGRGEFLGSIWSHAREYGSSATASTLRPEEFGAVDGHLTVELDRKPTTRSLLESQRANGLSGNIVRFADFNRSVVYGAVELVSTDPVPLVEDAKKASKSRMRSFSPKG